ncbi:killer cell lectin-like receptor subfamily I member 1 [Tupaia chinensis]|uniref:killer cell lectin-like receptor subfamily I member 1 n=1 Tax=Tupaia chinensis TaxID=246437 RepID=UPI000FFB6133|nr:killer cell lectin-like receptor subfamily I member 1 [Tupaia chinensis]XP_027632403.1 killer cell lectin-like receptor subfamily I member 1 [Tupaia chinensis]
MEKKPEVTNTEQNISRSQQKQRLSRADKTNIISHEDEIKYMELKFQKSSHLQHRKSFVRKKRKDPRTITWQVITGSLGVFCIILITTVGVLLANLFSSQEEPSRNISYIPILSTEIKEYSYSLCSNHWFGLGNSFYQVSNEPKTWPESHAACAELNSHLLKIDIQEELESLSVFDIEGWIGLKMCNPNGSWLWEDGTKVAQSLVTVLNTKNHCCAYINGISTYEEDCTSKKKYICELSI